MVDMSAAKNVPIGDYIRTDGLSLNICITQPKDEKSEQLNQQRVRAPKTIVS